jgi:hypothetical protein
MYELAFRENDATAVALLWDGVANRVLLSVRDVRAGEWFLRPVDPARALDAFRQPFAYVDRRFGAQRPGAAARRPASAEVGDAPAGS